MDSTTNIRADGDYDNILQCKVKLNDLKLNGRVCGSQHLCVSSINLASFNPSMQIGITSRY